MKLKRFTYTKDNGDISERLAVIVGEPKTLYLVYDVTKLSPEHLAVLTDALEQIEQYRENALADFELITGQKINSLWRSFKPGGIEWVTEDEI